MWNTNENKGLEMVAREETTTTPKWLMAVIGTVGSVILTGLISWMTALHQSTEKNTVNIATMEQQINNLEDNQKSSDAELKKRMDQVDTKLDRLLESVSDLRARSGVAGSAK
jgi:lysylphosphatidylglycerol synthetase-like protein (DUF2156 family)